MSFVFSEKMRFRNASRKIILNCAGAVIVREGKILFQRRTDNSKWGLIGGLVEMNETYEQAALREIREETGLEVRESDRVYVLNPCAFSTPGMTDESNAFLCAEITLDNLDCLNQNGAEGSELFDGFELLDREHAAEIFRTGRDDHGNFYSLAAWMVLSIFLSLF